MEGRVVMRTKPVYRKLRALFVATALSTGLMPDYAAGQDKQTASISALFGQEGASFSLSYLGRQSLPSDFTFNGEPFGGISGIDHDPSSDTYFAISDDRAEKGPARFYRLKLDVDAKGFHGVRIVSRQELKQSDGKPFAAKSVDPEDIRLVADGSGLLWSSEGDAKAGIPPFLRISDRDGNNVKEFNLPEGFAPGADARSGIRNNKAFEGVAVTPSGDVLLALENSLLQDGPEATLTTSSPVRILRFGANMDKASQTFFYIADPIPQATTMEPFWNDGGLSEILALDEYRFLAIERAFASGSGFWIRIYLADAAGATDVLGLSALSQATEKIIPARKTLLLDLNAQGLKPDNIEGATFALAADGTKLLILVSDSNFSAAQKTEFIAFKINR